MDNCLSKHVLPLYSAWSSQFVVYAINTTYLDYCYGISLYSTPDMLTHVLKLLLTVLLKA